MSFFACNFIFTTLLIPFSKDLFVRVYGGFVPQGKHLPFLGHVIARVEVQRVDEVLDVLLGKRGVAARFSFHRRFGNFFKLRLVEILLPVQNIVG